MKQTGKGLNLNIQDLSKQMLTLSPQSATKVPYANSLDPDEMPSNLASHLDPSCLTLKQLFHPI